MFFSDQFTEAGYKSHNGVNLNLLLWPVHWSWRLHGDPSALHDPQDEHLRHLCCRLHSGKLYFLVTIFLLINRISNVVVGGPLCWSHFHSDTWQAMEVFPTSVRQSGIGFCSFISQMISIGGPYAMAAGAVNVMVGWHINDEERGRELLHSDPLHDHDAHLPRRLRRHLLPAWNPRGQTAWNTWGKLTIRSICLDISFLQDANQFGRTDKYFSLKPNRGWGLTFSISSFVVKLVKPNRGFSFSLRSPCFHLWKMTSNQTKGDGKYFGFQAQVQLCVQKHQIHLQVHCTGWAGHH